MWIIWIKRLANRSIKLASSSSCWSGFMKSWSLVIQTPLNFGNLLVHQLWINDTKPNTIHLKFKTPRYIQLSWISCAFPPRVHWRNHAAIERLLVSFDQCSNPPALYTSHILMLTTPTHHHHHFPFFPHVFLLVGARITMEFPAAIGHLPLLAT